MTKNEKMRVAHYQNKANIWLFFTFKNKPWSEEFDKMAEICKFCNVAIKYTGNSTNLHSHIVSYSRQPKPCDPMQSMQNNIMTTNVHLSHLKFRRLRSRWWFLWALPVVPANLICIFIGNLKRSVLAMWNMVTC